MKKHNEEIEFIKPIHKMIFSVCAVVILLTISALAICYFNYPSAINFFTPSTLPPAAVVLIALYGFLTGVWGRMDSRKKYGFKYSKIDGKACVERPEYPRIGKSCTGACISFVIMSLSLPFIFFFSDKIKYLVGGISLGVIAVLLFGFGVVVLVLAMIEVKKQSEREKSEAERLRREQKRREEMGQWK